MYRSNESKMASSSKKPSSLFGTIVMLALLVVSGIALYFLYNFLFSSRSTGNLTTLVRGEIIGTKPAPTAAAPPVPYEGGDYTLSFWLYVNSYNVNRNTRKHIIDIGGSNFSTLLIALGAFKNTLVVRTHSREASATVSGTNTYAVDATNVTPTNTDLSGSGDLSGNTSWATPNSQAVQDGSLTTADKAKLLAPMALDDGLLNSSTICDLNEIDFQRWTLVTVVLSGRTVDVYIDGKLSRSCISSSYYKVDPTGVYVKLLGNGGFDGYLSNIKATNIGLNPSEIYNLYTKGPTA
jgi:hypothetical protein